MKSEIFYLIAYAGISNWVLAEHLARKIAAEALWLSPPVAYRRGSSVLAPAEN
jgi:hypothetical protein